MPEKARHDEPGAPDPQAGASSRAERDDATEQALPCVCCGYDLRGLNETGLCPECSTPIRRSVVDNLLVHADRNWLKGLVIGCRVLWIGSAAIAISLALSLLLVLVMIVSIQLTAAFQDLVDQIFPLIQIAVLITLILGVIILLIGAALSTRQEPRVSLTESQWSPRRKAQIMLVALAIVITLHITFRLTLPILAGSLTYRIAFLLLLSVTTAMLAHGLFRHLRGIVARVPDLERARWSSRQARDLVILLPLAFFGFALLGTGGPGVTEDSMLLVSLWAAASLFCTLALLVLLARLLTLPWGLRRLHRAIAIERDRALARDGAVDPKPASS